MRAVRDFMTKDPVTVPSSTTLTEAACLMREHNIGFLPVVDGGKFVGVVTDRDIVIRGVADGSIDCAVGAILSSEVTCLAPDDDDARAASLMNSADVRRLPVTEGGRLVGIVSVGDLAVRADAQLAGEVIEGTGPGRNDGAHGGEHEPRVWPGKEMTANTVSNADAIGADSRLSADTLRDISNEGVVPTPGTL